MEQHEAGLRVLFDYRTHMEGIAISQKVQPGMTLERQVELRSNPADLMEQVILECKNVFRSMSSILEDLLCLLLSYSFKADFPIVSESRFQVHTPGRFLYLDHFLYKGDVML
jgi:hypothetical protein